MLTVIPKRLENSEGNENGTGGPANKLGLWNIIPVSGGYMIRVNGFPVYQLGLAIGAIVDKMDTLGVTTRTDLVKKLAEARVYLDFAAGNNKLPDGTESVLPADSKAAAQSLINTIDTITGRADAEELPPLSPVENASLITSLFYLYNILYRDLHWFDLYWIRPKLGYATTELLRDATIIFPESIRGAISDPIKYEIQQAANCLLYEASSAVGFHILRAVEMAILDYFTITGWERSGANSWVDYAKRLRSYGVHRKIVGMVDRLAGLHRNELMHAEAVLSLEEAAILFHLMQEVLPIMIADVAKRKGIPITDFPILNDPKWQPQAAKRDI